MAFVKDVN